MTSTFSVIRRRAVVLLAGTAIALLAPAAPAFAEPGSDNPVTTSTTTEASDGAGDSNLYKKKRPQAPVISEIVVTKPVDSVSPSL